MKERTAPRRQPRPVYFTREQLDELCETIISNFCMERYGQELTPVPTEALPQLLEDHAPKVDQFADLPDGTTGVTEYYWDHKLIVKIDARLTQLAGDPWPDHDLPRMRSRYSARAAVARTWAGTSR